MKIRYFFFTIILLFTGKVNAQSDPSSKLNSIISAPPDAAMLTKYGEYPVSNFTGLPDINVPLHTISVRDIKIPITINYHAAGNKVSDLASWVGLGWTLNAGGVITRTVKGIPDEDQDGILNRPIKDMNSIRLPEDNQYLSDIKRKQIDSEPDEFSFNIMGKSGRFTFTSEKQVLLTPFSNMKISFENDKFTIVDENGITYYFEERAASSRLAELESPIYFPTTAWYLTKIVSTNNIDVVTFKYEQFFGGNIQSVDYSVRVGWGYQPKEDNTTTGVHLAPYLFEGTPQREFYYENPGFCYLKEISFPGGKVLFVKRNGERLDYGGLSLETMVIQEGGNVLKNIKFQQDYFFSEEGANLYVTPRDKYRLKLNGISISGIPDNNLQQYRFEYEEQFKLPPRNTFGIDFGGYSNGAYRNKHLIPLDDDGQQYKYRNWGGFEMSSIINDPANRRSNSDHMKAGMLKRIYYPTGGFTEFEFEPNQVELAYNRVIDGEKTLAMVIGTKQDSGPVNVEFVSPVDNPNAKLTVNVPLWHDLKKPYLEFRDLTQVGYERFVVFPGEQGYFTKTINLVKDRRYRLTANIQPNPLDPNDNIDERVLGTVGYPERLVESSNKIQYGAGLRIKNIRNYSDEGKLTSSDEFKYGEKEDGNGKLRFFDFFFQNRAYVQATEYFFAGGSPGAPPTSFEEEEGRALIVASRPVQDFSSEQYRVAYPYVTKYRNNYTTGKRLKTIYEYSFVMDEQVHEFTGSAIDFAKRPLPEILISNAWKSGELLRETVYSGLDSLSYSPLKQISYQYEDKIINESLALKVDVIKSYSTENPYFNDYMKYFTLINYPRRSGINKLVKKEVTDFQGANLSSTTTEEYSYLTDKNVLPRMVARTNSRNEKFVSTTSYPSDYLSGTVFLDQMKLKNNLSQPIENVIYKEVSDGANIISGNVFTYDDEGKGLLKRADRLESVSALPLSTFKFSNKAMGVLPNSGAQAKFQMDSRYKLKQQVLQYDKYGNPLTVQNTENRNTSYLWGYDGQYPIAEIKNATYDDLVKALTQPVIDNLNLNTHSEATMETLIKSAADKLRTSLPKAMITSYTYKPLVGMTSKTDPRGVKETYKYDGMQRLQAILDHLGHVTKAIDYHYRSN